MATQIRQSNLFAAEDWKVVYEAFRKIDLNSYDYDTIRTAMVNHLRTTYPDTFNDWINNQEFIFILDTLCFLGQNLAFRMDLNTRENFIDTAERRESILRLSQMLSYSPRRNYPGRGTVKLTQISTNQDVRDSSGNSLSGRIIRWNDPLNPDWYEQFILVMNANFVESNPFGNPVKRISTGSGQIHLYKTTSIAFSNVAYPFSATVNGQSMTFEVVNPDVDEAGTVFERHPDPSNGMFILYQNDGNGFSSPNTGFFMYFKQGTLKFSDYEYSIALENRTTDINVANINELDVWVQKTSENGGVLESDKWTKVPSTQNIMYNSVNQQIKSIYSVVTKDQDMISIRFPDSNTGTVPRGKFRMWYRVSNGLTYTIKTTDIQNKTIRIRTRGHTQSINEESMLELRFSLEYQVQNSQAQETIEQIRLRAPQTYYTSNRLINGEDYNIGPLRQGNLVKKSKAINRTYSGHSRFIDINDPTSHYQNANVFGDDGVMYRDTLNARMRTGEPLPTSKPDSAIVSQKIQPLLGYAGMRELYEEQNGDYASGLGYQIKMPNRAVVWNADYTRSPYGAVGVFEGGTLPVSSFHVGMLLKVTNLLNPAETLWVSVVRTDPYDSEITLSKVVPNGWYLETYYVALKTSFNSAEVMSITMEMAKRTDFGLYYDIPSTTWKVSSLATTFDLSKDFDMKTNYCFIKAEYNGASWDFIARGVSYIFMSNGTVQFFTQNQNKQADINSGIAKMDEIIILKSNANPAASNVAYVKDVDMVIDDVVKQVDGKLDYNRVVVKTGEIDSNGTPNNPALYRTLVPKGSMYEIEVFLKNNSDNSVSLIGMRPEENFYVYDPTYNPSDVLNQMRPSWKYRTTIDVNKPVGTVFYYKPSGIFIRYTSDQTTLQTPTLDSTKMGVNTRVAYLATLGMVIDDTYVMQLGRTGIYYQWKHYAAEDRRIDPAITNIHDTYVITSEYYTQVDQWAKSRTADPIPRQPTSTELRTTFNELEKIKATSDTLIWHSGTFIPLFGSNSKQEYQASFRIVRVPGSKYSDDEIRQQVVRAINSFFNIDNWDFGDSFYFTELATYIHQSLATDIASVVIVPKSPTSKFGSLFQITCEPQELFISTAKVEDVEIINSLTPSNMKVGY